MTENAQRQRATLGEPWATRLATASAPEIVALANEYVATWREDEVMRLPPGCVPPRMRTADDISSYALTLTRAQLAFAGPAATEALLERLAVFFLVAASRLAHLGFIAGSPRTVPIVLTPVPLA
jgi:hypothetical protein